MSKLNEIEKKALILGLKRLRSAKTEQFENVLTDYLDDELPSGTMKALIDELEEIRQEYLAISTVIINHETEGLI